MSSDFLKETGEATGNTGDPLEQYNEEQKAVESDAYEWYLDNHVRGKVKDSYVNHYERAFKEWKAFMAENHPNRHPTLANKYHIQEWIDELSERMNGDGVRDRVRLVSKVYHQLQMESEASHPEGYDPFELAKSKKSEKLKSEDPDDFPPLGLDDVREVVKDIKHIGERAATVFALKTGARPSEVANVRMDEIHLRNEDVLAHYNGEGQDHGPMGSHDQLKGRPNAVYIPPEDDLHPNNKRLRPTVIPIDVETRRALIDWLLIRPDNGDPWLFLSQKGRKMVPSNQQYVWREKHWTEYQYRRDEEYRSVTPHWARHWMSSWFRTQAHMPEPWVQYLRGDKQGPDIGNSREAMHRYIHSYYEDIEQTYRDDVFDLGL